MRHTQGWLGLQLSEAGGKEWLVLSSVFADTLQRPGVVGSRQVGVSAKGEHATRSDKGITFGRGVRPHGFSSGSPCNSNRTACVGTRITPGALLKSDLG